MKTYDLDKLANATGQELSAFLAENSNVIGEVTGHIANLQNLKGVSQAHALGFAAYLPDDYDVKQLDTHLSKKGYQMTLESLSTVLLVAASAAIVAGVGILAYKLYKMATEKTPTKALDAVKKGKAVEKMARALSSIGLTGLADATSRDLMLERFRKDINPALLEGASDADLLNTTLDFYVRHQLHSAGVNYWVPNVNRRGQGAILVTHLSAYMSSVDDAIGEFTKKLVDVVNKAPDITDLQLNALLDDRRWDVLDSPATASAVSGIVKALEVNKLPISNSFVETLRSSMTALKAPATVEQINEWRLGSAEPYQEELYEKAFKVRDSLKKTADYIDRVKKNLHPAEGRGQAVIDRFKGEVEKAQSLLDTMGLINELLLMETTAMADSVKYWAEGSKHYASALRETLENFTSEEDKRELRDALKKVFSSSDAQAVTRGTMATESLVRYESLDRLLVLEGHGKTQFVEFLKVVGVILLIGLAAQLIMSVILSMTGVQSMAASFAGGVVYFAKNGKRITPGEAADMVAEKAKDRGLGQYGVQTLQGMSKTPFRLDPNGIKMSFGEAAVGLDAALATFSSNLGDTKNLREENLVKACNAGSGTLDKHIKILQGRLKDMKFSSSFGDSASRSALEQLKDGQHEYEREWFDGSKANHDVLKQGIDTTWFGTLAKDAPSVIDNYTTIMNESVEKFSRKVKTIDKGDMESMSREAQDTHADFIQKLAYFETLSAVVLSITKKAMRDQLLAMDVMKATLKMNGENIGGVEQFEDEAGETVHYADPIDHMFEHASATTDLYALEQYEVMVTEDWKRVLGGVAVVLGALFVIGVTATILTALFSSRRSSSSFANDRVFKKIELDMKAILGSEEQQARRTERANEMANQLQADLEKARKDREEQLKRHREHFANSSRPGAGAGGYTRTEKEVKGERIYPDTAAKAAPVAPAAGITGPVVGGANSAASVAPESVAEPTMSPAQAADAFQVIMENPPVNTYRHEIEQELKRMQATVGQTFTICEGTTEAINDFVKDGLPKLDAFDEVLTMVSKGIIQPTATLSTQSDPNSYAEANYEKLIDSIHEIVQTAHKAEIYFGTDGGMDKFEEGMRDLIEKVNMPAPDDLIQRGLGQISPETIRQSGSQYKTMVSIYTDRLDNAEKRLKDINDRFNKHTIDNLDDLKGNRDKASSWMRRIEEFKAVLAEMTRGYRAHLEFLRSCFETVELGIRVHRRVQKKIGEQMIAGRDKLVKLRDAVGGPGASKTLDEMLDEIMGTTDQLNKDKE